MIFNVDEIDFEMPRKLAFTRRILIKPNASRLLPYPDTTSRETLVQLIKSIRETSEADILIIEHSQEKERMDSIYRFLSYDFPQVTLLDAQDSTLVEVENPLKRPYALPSFWIPNIILSCDYLITTTTFKIVGGSGSFCLENILSMLPPARYRGEISDTQDLIKRFDIHSIIADLYFTLPFDLGIIDAHTKIISNGDFVQEYDEGYNKIFIGDPYEIDLEASQSAGIEINYLSLIKSAKARLAAANEEGNRKSLK